MKEINYNITLTNLESEDPKIRDKAALEFIDFIEAGKKSLISQINKPLNENHRGTLVYALEFTNCEDDFDLVVDSMLFGNAEVYMSALNIYLRHDFKLSKELALSILNKITKFEADKELNRYHDEEKEDRLRAINNIKKYVEYFLDK